MKSGLHEYLDGIQRRLIEISGALHRQYCEWLDPEAAKQSQSQSVA